MVTQAVPTERRISPYARRLAAQRRIPAVELVGTGPGGEVVAKDVRRAGADRDAACTRRRDVDEEVPTMRATHRIVVEPAMPG
jgi:pyruvate/2-oxoglutarate dehydrogenase complex dihydrolipoamide acyltransferase (E2) component